jgi:hypothetical protein
VPKLALSLGDPHVWLDERAARLDSALREVACDLDKRDPALFSASGGFQEPTKIPVRMKGGNSRAPATAWCLPPASRTLSQVERWTGFIQHFGHVSTGLPPGDERAFLATDRRGDQPRPVAHGRSLRGRLASRGVAHADMAYARRDVSCGARLPDATPSMPNRLPPSIMEISSSPSLADQVTAQMLSKFIEAMPEPESNSERTARLAHSSREVLDAGKPLDPVEAALAKAASVRSRIEAEMKERGARSCPNQRGTHTVPETDMSEAVAGAS